MNNTNIRLFLGYPIEDPGERALISRLQRDLGRRGACATLYANFFPVARRTCQVDLLVRTGDRTAHVEIKSLRPDYPLRAGLNGPWVQVLPDGRERSLGTNCGYQAREGTFAISDAMRDLVRNGVVVGPEGDLKHYIDSFVGIWEVIPSGSDIQAPPHVTVLGYDDLLERLATLGRTVPWGDGEWDTFARTLGLFQPDADSESERRRRSSLEGITEYCMLAQCSLADGLDAFVDVGVVDDDGGEEDATDISRKIEGGAVLAVVGPPGCGKSFLGKHLAVRQCDDGCMAVWIRADQYQTGRFKELLARAMAPFSAQRWSALVKAAEESGTALTIVVDGLNECPSPERGELIQQLRAFTLRHRANVLITSTTDDGLRDTLNATVLRVREPSEQARQAILVSHGAKHPKRISEQFRTPYELKIAAECESELHEKVPVTELHAAYIRRFARTEQTRAGLRSLAGHLHANLRSSMPLHEASAILNSRDRGLVPGQADEVLDCRLLDVDHHRVRFRHDLIGQFFAAEEVVCSATSGENLGWLLGAPANTVLTETALSLEGDPIRVWDALRALASPELIFSALTADYGPDVAEIAAQEVGDVIRRATACTATVTASFTSTGGLFGRWTTEHPWPEWERALMVAAGKGLTRGLFVDEVCALIDRTDEVCLAQALRLRNEGNRTAVSRVVAATYALPAAPDEDKGLAASYIVRAFEMTRMMTRDWRPRELAGSFAAGANARSWGRLYLALLSADFRDVRNQALFASLLRQAWDANGYHLRLKALRVAAVFSGSDEPYRSEILSVLWTLESKDMNLQSSLLEALAYFGEIENETTAEELRTQIRATLSHSEDIEYCRMASGMVANQFEDEAIFGPYFEAIEGLTYKERAQLFTMAARGSDPTFSGSLDWTLHQLADLVPTGDAKIDSAAKSVFSTFLDGPVEDAIVPQEAVNACLLAIRGWAKFEAALPDATGLAPEQRNWRLVARLLLHYERLDAVVDVDETWRALLRDQRETVLTLASLDSVTRMSPEDLGLGRLLEDYPKRLRELFEWALDNPTELPVDRLRPRTFANHFVIRMLGAVGDASTAARLRMLTKDPESGRAAVDAIRQIHRQNEAIAAPLRTI